MSLMRWLAFASSCAESKKGLAKKEMSIYPYMNIECIHFSFLTDILEREGKKQKRHQCHQLHMFCGKLKTYIYLTTGHCKCRNETLPRHIGGVYNVQGVDSPS